MGLTGFAGGAADALQQMLEERRAAFLQQQALEMRQAEAQRQAEQFSQTMEMQRKRFDADEVDRASDREYRAGQTARQGRLDDVAAGERRQVTNNNEVRRMALEGLRLRTANPQTAQQMVYGETGEVIPKDVLDPDADLRDYEAKRKIDARYRAPAGGGSTERLTLISPDGKQQQRIPDGPQANALLQQGWKLFDPVAARQGGGTDGQPSQYAIDTATRTIAAIDDVLPKINAGTAGLGGAVLSRIPGTPAANVSAQLATVAGNIAFNALQQMREASKTGGALGQVAIQELEMLKAVEGSLRQNQSPQNLREQLGKVRESQARFLAAASMGSGLQMQRSGAPQAGSGNLTWDPVKKVWVK